MLKINPILEEDCAPVSCEERVVHYADHLMLLNRLKLDPLRNPQAPAKECLPWLNHYSMKRADMKIEIDNPIVQRELILNDEMKKYLKTLGRGILTSWFFLGYTRRRRGYVEMAGVKPLEN